MEKLVDAGPRHQDHCDEFRQLLGMLGDIVDGLESIQARYADPAIETQLADLRYAVARLAKLLIE